MYEMKNKFKKEKFVVLAEYFEQQRDCSRYRGKISQSRISLSWRNQSYGAIIGRTCNLRTTLEKYFRFQ